MSAPPYPTARSLRSHASHSRVWIMLLPPNTMLVAPSIVALRDTLSGRRQLGRGVHALPVSVSMYVPFSKVTTGSNAPIVGGGAA